MRWFTYPLKALYYWRFGKWIIAKIVFIKNGNVETITARNRFPIIPKWVKEAEYYNLSKIRFKLISYPFEIVSPDTIIPLRFRNVSIEWKERLVRLDNGTKFVKRN